MHSQSNFYRDGKGCINIRGSHVNSFVGRKSAGIFTVKLSEILQMGFFAR